LQYFKLRNLIRTDFQHFFFHPCEIIARLSWKKYSEIQTIYHSQDDQHTNTKNWNLLNIFKDYIYTIVKINISLSNQVYCGLTKVTPPTILFYKVKVYFKFFKGMLLQIRPHKLLKRLHIAFQN